MEDLEKLRSTFAWKSIGFERAKPEPCNNSFEYSDADLVKLDSSKFKGDFQTSFSFRKCNLADSKVRWSELNYVKFEGCRAVGSSFSQVELSFGEGIADSYSEKCTFKNVGISNMCMAGRRK